MGEDWRGTLEVLRPQFEALASKALGLHHFFIEDARKNENDEKSDFLPPGLHYPSNELQGLGTYGRWQISSIASMRSKGPSFREPNEAEEFATEEDLIRDQAGDIRAVAERSVSRFGYYFGKTKDTFEGFRYLATAAATALTGVSNLHEHVFASDLVDLFRRPRGGIRYVFGRVPSAPTKFIASGWDAGILQFKHGVLIDLPLGESEPDAEDWLLLIHRLGWHSVAGSALRAMRKAWKGNVECDVDSLPTNQAHKSEEFKQWTDGISGSRFYSLIGSKQVPLDINLASALAIKLLVGDLSSSESSNVSRVVVPPSRILETRLKRKEHPFKTVTLAWAKKEVNPLVALVVVTEVERSAVLKQLQPPGDDDEILQIFEGANTYVVGRIGMINVILCRSAMGSIGRDSSLTVTSELITNWRPNAVIMLGIAFGRDSNKQRLGSVLISDRIIPYEPQRLGEAEDQERGVPIQSGAVLLDRFNNMLGWKFLSPDGEDCGFQVGPILSGEKLVDNTVFKDDLFNRYPKAIGGEMEGAGLAAACSRQMVEWIVVKAICDWGDGTKTNDYQEFAAAASVSLIAHIMNQPGIFDALAESCRSQ